MLILIRLVFNDEYKRYPQIFWEECVNKVGDVEKLNIYARNGIKKFYLKVCKNWFWVT